MAWILQLLSSFAVLAAATTEDSNAVSFTTLGCWGSVALGSYHAVAAKAVAAQMGKTAAGANASFVVNTGDNFYYCGITTDEDKQIKEDFEDVYTAPSLQVPWYSILGNHEYGYSVEAQLQLPGKVSRWVMDDRYYTRRVEIAPGTYISFIFIDTSPCVQDYRSSNPQYWDPCGSEFPTCDPIDEGPCKFNQNIVAQDCTTQFTWFKEQLAKVPKSDWLIVVGHHPADEINVEDFTSAMQSHGFDLYLNAHTHVLCQYTIDGSGAYVTSGAGGMVKTADQDFEKRLHCLGDEYCASRHSYQEVFYKKVAGFTLHTFSSDLQQLTTQFINYEGETIHQFTVTRGAGREIDIV